MYYYVKKLISNVIIFKQGQVVVYEIVKQWNY